MNDSSSARTWLAVLALALAGCDGTSDGAEAVVQIGFQSSTASASESDAPIPLTLVLTSSYAALPWDASVEVVDLGTGTATAGTDHAVVAARRVTFPRGSLDGATEVVRLGPLEDDFVEGDETVVLALRSPRGGALAGARQLTVTLLDADAAEVSFATAAGAASEGSAGHVAVELDCGAAVTLQVDVGVLVSDLLAGTARADDYAAFPAQQVVFPAGSADGAVETLSLALLDDATPEVLETIALGLTDPRAGTLGPIRAHVLTIEDDDLSGPAAFRACEGPTGTENELVHNATLALGADAVGGDPGPATEVRVANLGGEAMVLDAPEVYGANAFDFSVVVASSSLAVPSASDAPVERRVAVESRARLDEPPGGAGPGTLLRLESAELARVAPGAAARLRGVVLPDGGTVTLELARRPLPIAPGAKLTVDGEEIAGGPRTLLGDLQVWSGSVSGVEGSRAFLALDGRGARGFVRLPGPAGDLVHLLPEGPDRVRVVAESEVDAFRTKPQEPFCAGELEPPGRAASAFTPGAPGDSTSALAVTDCRLAIETDFQLFELLGSSSVLLTDYVTSLIAAASEQFATDVQTRLSLAYLGIHTTADDGWSTPDDEDADKLDLLYEFQAAWGFAFQWPVEANLAHFLSGADLGGGVAYVEVLCDPDYGYGVSQLFGGIDWPAWTGEPATFTWDFYVVAHELGHNFGALHTGSYCPPLDECAPSRYWENCQDEVRCQRGTIMSSCHLDCGDMSNIDLYFHPVTANDMRVHANLCLEPAALFPGDYVQYRLRFDPITQAGPRSGTLNFRHDATNTNRPFVVRMTGLAE